MPPISTRLRGYTLIEILTCIALGAMLVTIAVPNFQQRRLSTNLAQARTDLQTLITGLEAYRADLGAYPWMNNHGSALAPYPSSVASGPTLERLTTPVSYLSNTEPFYDPFIPHSIYAGIDLETVEPGYNPWIKQYFYHARNLVDTSVWGQASVHDTDPLWYLLESSGPDQHHHSMWRILNSMASDTEDNRTTLSKTIYDPTNGSLSRGSLWEVGGDPQGRGSSMATTVNSANSSRVAGWLKY